MKISVLQQIVSPPSNPVAYTSVDIWTKVEKSVGFVLPGGYKEFVDSYGGGILGEFLVIYSPFVENKYLNFVRQSSLQLEALRDLREKFGVTLPFALFPEKDGVIPWGGTENGDILLWLVKREHTRWTVAVYSPRDQDYEEYDIETLEFIYNFVLGKLNSDLFPEDIFEPGEDMVFEPIN